jgi:hypothetical protein
MQLLPKRRADLIRKGKRGNTYILSRPFGLREDIRHKEKTRHFAAFFAYYVTHNTLQIYFS